MINRYDEIQQKIMEYRDKKSANLLLPSLSLQIAEGSIYVPELEAVYISTDAADGEVYKGSSKDKFRLHSKALFKIAQAGGLEWDTQNSCVVQMPGNIVGYRAVGGIRKSTGELNTMSGYKDIDFDIAIDDIKEQYSAKEGEYNKTNPDWWKKMSPEAQKNYIQSCIDRDFRAQRKYAQVKCETGAKCRVMRGLFFINAEYTEAQLRKPFVVLRYRPDLNSNNPHVRQLLLETSLKAALNIFGAAPQQVYHQPQIAAPIQPADDPNIDFDDPIDQESTEPMTPEPPPELPSDLQGFKAVDFDIKIMAIKNLIARKGYKGPADPNGPIWMSKEASLVAWFESLIAMPDVADETDQIPYQKEKK